MMDYSSTLHFESQTTPGVTFEIYKPSTARKIEFDRLNAEFRQKARTLQTDISQNDRELQEDARKWYREQEAKVAKARALVATALDVTPEVEEAKALIEGYEADREVALLRQKLANYDLEALSSADAADPRVLELRALMQAVEEKAAKAISYQEPFELAEERQWLRREADILMDEYYRPARVRWGVASLSGFSINGKPATVESQLQFGPPDLTGELFAKVEEVTRMDPEKLKKSVLPIISSAAVVGSETSTTATDASKANSTSPGTAVSISLS